MTTMEKEAVRQLCSSQEAIQLFLRHSALTVLRQTIKEELDPLRIQALLKYDFCVAEEYSSEKYHGKITDPELLYLSNQEDLVLQYYGDLDEITLQKGFHMKEVGMCPILIVGHELIKLEQKILDTLGKALDCNFDCPFSLENRRKAVELFLTLVTPFAGETAKQKSLDLGMPYLRNLKACGEISP